MATYDPPQPMWKRNLAGILDFFLTFLFAVTGWQKYSAIDSIRPTLLANHSYPSHSRDVTS
jgi:hypothetical protein